MNHMMRMVL